MKSITACLIFLLSAISCLAQQDSFDIVKFTPLKGWKKDARETIQSYSITDSKTGGWCQISIVKSTISKGDIDKDFESEWAELIVKPYDVKELPETNAVQEVDGWKIKAGGGKFVFNNANAITLLTTMSGFERCVSIVANTNSQDYLSSIQTFLESVDLKKPEKRAQKKYEPPAGAVKSSFKFNTTNFDDGWMSIEKQDWVEVTRGSIKVLIHYANKTADAYNAVLKDGDYTAWNTLVAPRYSNMSNFEWKSIQSWQSISFMQGDATENATGKPVHIVLFKEHYSNGSGAYLEFVTNSKEDYENEFGPYHNESYGWDKTANMQWRNRFAIAAEDLNGTWTNNFSGMTQYVNAYTGASAGADTHASSQKFEFGPGNTYKWDIGVASGFVGNIKFQSAKSSGKFVVVTPWQIKFSEMEGKPKTYDAYFSCAKGARLLWLSDVSYPGYSAYGKAN
jgi:hypothetical protein